MTSVLHLTSWLSRQGGGIPPVIWSLAGQLQATGIPSTVAGLHDQWVAEDCAPFQVPYVTGAIQGPPALGYSPALAAQVSALATPGRVVHSHGLWMWPGALARQAARRAGCPLLVSPHGMLEPWALNHSRWKKRLAGFLFEHHNLRAAHCLHALCPAEAENFRRYGLKNPIAIIPNGIDRADPATPESQSARHQLGRFVRPGQKVLLFLSRLHPKKGLDNLLAAWRTLADAFPDWVVLIAGAGAPAYEDHLKTRVQTYDLTGRVHFLGAVHGAEKNQVFVAADAFVLPSFSEGFSMAILEAAAAGLPVVLTPECNFPELAAAGGAIEIAPDVSSVTTGLRRVLALTAAQREEMGRRAQTLVQADYTWPAVAGKMVEVYHWLLTGGPRPACVV